ncbi:MAG: TatD family hydrolase [Candidatus Micrarchaeota archaeon]
MFVDSHCHLEDMKETNFEDVLTVTVGYSHRSNVKNFTIATEKKLPFVLGIAPQTALKEDITRLNEWIDFIKNTNIKPNAIGEIGLDYHWAKTKEDINKEMKVFDEMLNLSEQMKLPVVIHSRSATKQDEETKKFGSAESDVIKILKERGFSKIMMHFFSGKADEAEAAFSLGAYISIPPLRSKERKETIKRIPLENLLVETDSPYVVRTPLQVKDSVEYIAEIKNLDFEIVKEQTAKNAIKLFNIRL